MPSLASTPALDFFTMPFKKRKYTINPPDEIHNVVYLGNVLTVIGKGEQSIEKPLSLIWKAYCSKQQKQEISMKLYVTRSGLKAETKLQGLTEYWAHRITYSCAPTDYPKIFCWIYKHDGKKMKPELRCHAVLCKKTSEPLQISSNLKNYLQTALAEYKREKLCIEKARKVSVQAGGYGLGPKRKLILQSGSLNFRPPVSRSKSAPRLGSIDEEDEMDEPIQQTSQCNNNDENNPQVKIETIDDEDDEAFYDHRSTPIGDDICSQSSYSSSNTNKAEENENDNDSDELDTSEIRFSFKRNLSMNSAAKKRHQSLPHKAKQIMVEELVSHLKSACLESTTNDNSNQIIDSEDELPLASDTTQAQTSSCASSDDGFASSCQSGDLDQLHHNQRASLRRRIKAITEPDSISDESGYNESSGSRKSQSTSANSQETSSSQSYSEEDDEDEIEDIEFENQRKAALTAQRIIGQSTTLELEPNVQITAL